MAVKKRATRKKLSNKKFKLTGEDKFLGLTDRQILIALVYKIADIEKQIIAIGTRKKFWQFWKRESST